jgi:hypothetical protein
MATCAVRLGEHPCPCDITGDSTAAVLGMRDRLKMGGIYALVNAAQVIQVHVTGHWPD